METTEGSYAKVLLVEHDELPTRRLLRTNFDDVSHRFHVVTASTLSQAIATAVVDAFDVVVLDWLLPGLDGFKGLKRFVDIHFRLPLVIVADSVQFDAHYGTALACGAHEVVYRDETHGRAFIRSISHVITRARLDQSRR